MDLLVLLFLVAIIGLVCYLLVTYVPMPGPFKTLVIVIGVAGVLILLYNVFGGYLPHVHVGK